MEFRKELPNEILDTNQKSTRAIEERNDYEIFNVSVKWVSRGSEVKKSKTVITKGISGETRREIANMIRNTT